MWHWQEGTEVMCGKLLYIPTFKAHEQKFQFKIHNCGSMDSQINIDEVLKY
jgi:hypothetical protein